jgi:NADPH oxidase 5
MPAIIETQDDDDEKDENSNKQVDRYDQNMIDDQLGYIKMYNRTNQVSAQTIGPEQHWRLKVFLDGPYGTPSHDIYDSEHAVLVAAGIGITPFASILQSMMYKYRQSHISCPNCNNTFKNNCSFGKIALKKVDFIWITRDQRSLEWFITMLAQIEIEQRKHNENFLETHLYVTSAKRQSDLKSISLHFTLDAIFSHEDSALIDGLRQRTHVGRPNWDIIMQNMLRKKKGKIDFFYCGPPALASVLQQKCNEYKFNFKKELF